VGDAKGAIRNISEAGRKNRLYGGIALISLGLGFSLLGPPSSGPLFFTLSFGIFTSGCLVLLESTSQVCVYHGFLGTHESSSGGKRHENEDIARACRTRSWGIIFQSMIGGLLITLVLAYFLS
tara:strand:- start:5024 stop:5392 length:369 start_codon:yes stop_codon:yes gene_type:complete